MPRRATTAGPIPVAWICPGCKMLNRSGGLSADRQCELCAPELPLPDRLGRARRLAGLTLDQAALAAGLESWLLGQAELQPAKANQLQREELLALAKTYRISPAIFFSNQRGKACEEVEVQPQSPRVMPDAARKESAN